MTTACKFPNLLTTLKGLKSQKRSNLKCRADNRVKTSAQSPFHNSYRTTILGT